MSRVYIGGAYPLDEYVIERPIVSVPSAMLSGSFAARETTITTRYKRGLFDSVDALFSINEVIEIYDDDLNRIFSGYISSITHGSGVTTLTCNTLLHRKLSGIVDLEVSNYTPTDALAQWFDSVGISYSNLDYTGAEYSSMLVNVYCNAAQGVKGYDLVSAIVDMITADISIVDDTVVFYDRDNPYVGYTISDIMTYPEQVDDGSQKYVRGTSIRYLFDGQVPYTEGVQGEKVWNPDYSNGSAYQLSGASSASIASSIRLARYGTPHPVYRIKVRKYAAPIILGAWYVVNTGTMSGNYRLIAYDTDGECFWLQLEAE